MLDKKEYANGQKTYELDGNRLTYFFKDGKVKAEGLFEDEKMEGEWKFYLKAGLLTRQFTYEQKIWFYYRTRNHSI